MGYILAVIHTPLNTTYGTPVWKDLLCDNFTLLQIPLFVICKTPPTLGWTNTSKLWVGP